jgi:hypothetical protein
MRREKLSGKKKPFTAQDAQAKDYHMKKLPTSWQASLRSNPRTKISPRKVKRSTPLPQLAPHATATLDAHIQAYKWRQIRKSWHNPYQPIPPQPQALLPQMQVFHQMNLPGQMPQNYQTPMAPQYIQSYTSQPPQMPMYHNNTMQQNSGMMQQQQQQKPPYNNYTQQQSKPPYQNFSRQRGNTNTQRGPAQQGEHRTDFLRGFPSEQVFLQPNHPDFQEIAKNFSKTMLGQDIIPSSETTYITHNDGTIVPAENIEVKPYPLKIRDLLQTPAHTTSRTDQSPNPTLRRKMLHMRTTRSQKCRHHLPSPKRSRQLEPLLEMQTRTTSSRRLPLQCRVPGKKRGAPAGELPANIMASSIQATATETTQINTTNRFGQEKEHRNNQHFTRGSSAIFAIFNF